MSQPVLSYTPILLFMVIAVGLGVVMLALGAVVRPSRPNPAKGLPYECGNIPVGDARVQVRSPRATPSAGTTDSTSSTDSPGACCRAPRWRS